MMKNRDKRTTRSLYFFRGQLVRSKERNTEKEQSTYDATPPAKSLSSITNELQLLLTEMFLDLSTVFGSRCPNGSSELSLLSPHTQNQTMIFD